MALIHDDDLACVANAVCLSYINPYLLSQCPSLLQSLGNLQPDTVMKYLQDFVPEIREIELECGRHFTIHWQHNIPMAVLFTPFSQRLFAWQQKWGSYQHCRGSDTIC